MVTRNSQSVVLDSCVWVAFLHKEDTQHAKARTVMEHMNRPVLVPEYVLLEVASVLAHKGYRTQAQAFVERVIHDSGVFLPMGDFVYDTARRFCEHHASKLSFVDIALLVLNDTYEVVTFDEHLHRALQKF